MDELMAALERANRDERLEGSLDLANRCYFAAHGNPAGSLAAVVRLRAAASGPVECLPYVLPGLSEVP